MIEGEDFNCNLSFYEISSWGILMIGWLYFIEMTVWLYDLMDLNRDGSIDRSELVFAASSVGITPEYVDVKFLSILA